MPFDWKEACINTERESLKKDRIYLELIREILSEQEVMSQITSLVPSCERLSYGKGCGCSSVCTIVKKYLEIERKDK